MADASRNSPHLVPDTSTEGQVQIVSESAAILHISTAHPLPGYQTISSLPLCLLQPEPSCGQPHNETTQNNNDK